MEKFIATFFMLLGMLQAETLFAGALTISGQTNWPRLGHYFQRQVAEWQEADQTPVAPVKAAKKKSNRYVNLSTHQTKEPE